MENKKLTAKIGNWQETVAMQTLMGDKVYDPRVKSTGTFTKMRVISHSDQIDSKDYKSTLNDCAPPQQHRDYVVSDEKGPRQLRMEAAIQKQVLAEEKERAAVVTSINNERYMVTTTNADFNASGFQSTKLGTSGAGGTTKKRDPYYVKDAAITYYLHTALHGKAFEFPATPIGDLNKIWLKGSSFTQGISKCLLWVSISNSCMSIYLSYQYLLFYMLYHITHLLLVNILTLQAQVTARRVRLMKTLPLPPLSVSSNYSKSFDLTLCLSVRPCLLLAVPAPLCRLSRRSF